MSEFSLDALDSIARSVARVDTPPTGKGKNYLRDATPEEVYKVQRTNVLNPQIQPEPDQVPQQPQSEFSFDVRNLDKQAFQIASGRIEQPKKEPSFLEKVGGNVAAGIDVLAGVPNFVGYGVGRAFGLTPQEAQRAASKVPEAIAQPVGRLTGMAEGQAYKQSIPVAIQNYIGEHLNEGAQGIANKFNIPLEDAQALLEAGLTYAGYKGAKVAPKALPKMQEAFEKVKEKAPSIRMEKAPDTMKGMGAAEVDAARLRQERGNELLIPMGEDLTKSQITRNPADVTFERETAKSPEFGGPLQEKYALQNKKLQQNLQAEVDATGAEMVGMDAPQFGKNISDAVAKYRNDRYADVSDAYKKAQEAGETAQPVPYKSITDLIEKETQGRPTKKSQNPLYAIVEEELKANDPNSTGLIPINAMEDIRKLINEEADPSKKGTVRLAKQLKERIDASTENAGGDLYKEARAKNRAFEAEFEDQGIIRDINRLKKGTSDRVVPLENLADKLIFGGTGEDVKAVFATLENMGPEGQQIAKELRGYAAEKIRQEATKGVGRDIEGNPYVSTAQLDKQIKALDKSGKLDFLFGPKQAERYRTLNEFTKDLQTVPQGTVNTSGTTATLLSALGEMALTGATTGVPAPVATIATYGVKKYRTGQKLKKVQEYANPKGTKLSDIPRIELKNMAQPD